MSLPTSELLRVLSDRHIIGELPAFFTGLETDSRAVRPGTLFVALRGEQVDGHDFAAAALAQGAAGVVVDHELPLALPQVLVSDTRSAISRLADAFFNRPSQRMQIAGVTGTNGKTTTVALIRAILDAAGSPCASVGTLGADFGEQHWPLRNTTPPAIELHALLDALHAAGAASAALEVSSHALALGRVDDVRFAVATFTNLTRDHLDFHGTLEEYARAKRRIFDLAPRAAINIDDPVGAQFAREVPHAITYAIDRRAVVRAERLVLDADGSAFQIDGLAVRVPLSGRFNAYNALAAFATARTLGVPDATIAAALASAHPVPGRMERITALGIEAIVDYAHTPDALENVLRATRETTRGKLIVVFGCGGDRDAGKRAQMGVIALDLADHAIVTSDNPRSEDPLAIARAIVAQTGLPIVLDRRDAIREAIRFATAGDTVIVAGKGHETYQIVGEHTSVFDDRAEVRAAFAERAAAQAAAAQAVVG